MARYVVPGRRGVRAVVALCLLAAWQRPASGQNFASFSWKNPVSGAFSQVNGASISYGPGGATLSNVTGASASAVLSIQQQGPALVVSWPTAVQGYSLQTSTNLSLGDWTTVSSTANTFVNSPGTPAGFFRLGP